MKRISGVLLTIVMLIVCVFGLSTTAYASASYKTIVDEGSSSKYSFKVDMNGDGKADSIVATFGATTDNWKRIVTVKMNGEKVLSLSADNFYSMRIQYVNLSKNAQFLYFHGYGDSRMPSIQALFRYDKSKKKMVKALNLMTHLGTAQKIVSVGTNSVTFSNGCAIACAGRVSWKFTYVYSGGKFSLKSPTAAAKYANASYVKGDGYDKYFAKSKYKAKKAFTVYSDLGGTKKAYNVKEGQVLQLKKIRYYKKGLYLQFANAAGKTGWIHGYQTYGTGNSDNVPYDLFYGVSQRLAGGFYG